MSVSHRHSHTNSQPQPQALPQPPQLLLSQPDLVLQLPLLHQQGGLHLHIVATKEKTEINIFKMYTNKTSGVLKDIFPLRWVIKVYCVVPVVPVLLRGEAAGQHPADGLLSAVNVVLQVLGLGQLPHELTLLLQQGELQGRERGGHTFANVLYLSASFFDFVTHFCFPNSPPIPYMTNLQSFFDHLKI